MFIGKGGRTVEDDLDGSGESSRSCSVAGYCRRTMFIEKLRAKKKKKKKKKKKNTADVDDRTNERNESGSASCSATT